mmetsp:Transcript_101214/g.257435  ORF Transcript_101214/g.257435 Transcript_101214/m.257435 type:complete len:261 (-) Transcript_101214:243-1025(-)
MFSAAGGGEDARVPRVMPARPTPAQQQQLLRMPTLGSSSCRSSANFDEELSALANHAAYELSYAKSDSAKELEERQDEVASANVDIIKETDAKTADETDEAKSEDCTAYASATAASVEDAGAWKQQLSEQCKNLDGETSALANHEAHELGNAKSKGAKQLDERQDDYAREVHLVACEVWAKVPAEALVFEVGEWTRKYVGVGPGLGRTRRSCFYRRSGHQSHAIAGGAGCLPAPARESARRQCQARVELSQCRLYSASDL